MKSELVANSHQGFHYKHGGIEPIEYIEQNHLDFHEGNIIKYVSRWKYKNGLDDLLKVSFYIDRLIELEGQQVQSSYRDLSSMESAR